MNKKSIKNEIASAIFDRDNLLNHLEKSNKLTKNTVKMIIGDFENKITNIYNRAIASGFSGDEVTKIDNIFNDVFYQSNNWNMFVRKSLLRARG